MIKGVYLNKINFKKSNMGRKINCILNPFINVITPEDQDLPNCFSEVNRGRFNAESGSEIWRVNAVSLQIR